MQKTKKVLSFLLCIAIICGMFSLPVFADNMSNIKVFASGEELSVQVIGTANFVEAETPYTLYYAKAPFGTTQITVSLESGWFVPETCFGGTVEDDSVSLENAVENDALAEVIEGMSGDGLINITDASLIASSDVISDLIYFSNEEFEGAPLDILLIQVSTVNSGGNVLDDTKKAPLSNLLETVKDGNSNYYLTNDRYNGKESDTISSKNGSFWAEFTAVNGPRAKAQNVLDTATTEDQITAAVAELETAISKLIPASQLNATYLYETLQQYNYGEEYLENCTVPSAQGFRAVRSEAQNYFNTLFNADGSATGVNIALNQKTADDYADALKNYTLVFNDQVDEAKVNLRTIQALAKRYAMTENGGKYTEESWTAFEAAREAATDYAAKHSVSEYISDAEVKQYAALTREFLSAAYRLTSASNTVTVTFSYTDDLHLRVPNPNDPYNQMVDPVGNKPQIQTVTLDRGATLADLWTTTGYKPSRSYYGVSEYSVWHTFVNGTMLYGVTPGAKTATRFS